MIRDDIIRMAHEAGFMAAGHPMNPWSADTDQIEAFAALVAAHEREACAKVCEDSDTWDLYDPNGFAANLIRARGEK
jgi:hypothetical protein